MRKRNKEVEKKYLSEHPFINELWTKQAERYLKCNPTLASANLLIKHQQKVINRLSRKIQKLKSGTFTIGEINKLLFCLDYFINENGWDLELRNIYERLYVYRERMKHEKKGF